MRRAGSIEFIANSGVYWLTPYRLIKEYCKNPRERLCKYYMHLCIQYGYDEPKSVSTRDLFFFFFCEFFMRFPDHVFPVRSKSKLSPNRSIF